MVFLTGGANTLDTGAYSIANSLRFDDLTAHLTFTPGSAGNRRKFTVSFWMKQCGQAEAQHIFFAGAGANYGSIYINGSRIFFYGESPGYNLNPSPLLRDPAAWYHIVCNADTEQGTAADRANVYFNGVKQTAFVTETYPSEDDDLMYNNDNAHAIGVYDPAGGVSSGLHTLDGYIAEMCMIDGSQLAASSFGETDEDSGIWKPKDVSGLTFGTNGFYLEFKGTGTSADASGKGADTSGNDNHWDDNNMDIDFQTTDTPTNNFCTLNTLNPTESNASFSEGNMKFTNTLNSSPHHGLANGTMAVAKGKWYWEVRVDAIGGTAMSIGAQEVTEFAKNDFTGNKGIGFFNNGNFHYRGTESTDPGTYTTNDIIGVALDMDNRKIWFHKNGTYEDSGDPTSGATGTGAVSLNALDLTMTPAVSNYNSGTCNVNFGNPAWAVSSTQADDDGYGNFEYDVPTGFYALCTKNLAEYG